MKRDRSEMGRALASIDQQIAELQRARQILIDARGPWRGTNDVPLSVSDVPVRRRRTKAEMAAGDE